MNVSQDRAELTVLDAEDLKQVRGGAGLSVGLGKASKKKATRKKAKRKVTKGKKAARRKATRRKS